MDYIYDLKQMKSEVAHILKEGDDKELVMAAKHYPGKLNHLLLKKDLKSVTLIFPFIDLPLFNKRKQNIELLDLNVIKDDSDSWRGAFMLSHNLKKDEFSYQEYLEELIGNWRNYKKVMDRVETIPSEETVTVTSPGSPVDLMITSPSPLKRLKRLSVKLP